MFIYYRSPNIVRVIKSRRLRWAGHVARMEDGRSAFKILTGKPTKPIPCIDTYLFKVHSNIVLPSTPRPFL